MNGTEVDGQSSSLFAGGGFMPSQATQTPNSALSKSRSASSVLPLTVKQIVEAFNSTDDHSSFLVDGVEASSIKLVGIVMNKAERVTDVSLTLDDGTGRINVNRWVNETSDTNEMELVQNGMYVKISGSLKGFQGKKHILAFSVRPVTDFNEVTLHFLECIHVHLQNCGPKEQGNVGLGTDTNNINDVKGYQTPVQNQVPPQSSTSNASASNIHQLVMDLFQEPASRSREDGLHLDEVTMRLSFPKEKIKDAINMLVDIGDIYSTVDENHFKAA